MGHGVHPLNLGGQMKLPGRELQATWKGTLVKEQRCLKGNF